MRLDKYLKVSRIVKRRTVANELCDAGRISINGKAAKASYNVQAGDIIEAAIGAKTTRARVLSTEEKTGKDTAREMYEIIG